MEQTLRNDAQADPALAPTILIVAGEASGDHHAAPLANYLRELEPHAKLFGMGGSHLRAAGVDTIVDSETEASVMGFTEVIGSLGKIAGAFFTILRECDRRKPEVAVLLDFPDFNMLLARALHRRGIRVVYYIAPQIWAWRKGRVKTIRKYIDRVATIFPFEQTFYLEHGVDAQFVGHPFLDRPPISIERNSYLSSLGIDPAKPVIALLPGSRKGEVERLLPVMAEAFAKLRVQQPELQAVLPVAETLNIEQLRELCPSTDGITFISGQARETLTSVDAAVVASGTATVEAALCRVPFVVVYRLAPVTYVVARLLVRGVKNFAMANLVAGQKVVEELLQSEVNSERIASELRELLSNETKRQKMIKDFDLVEQNLQRNASHSSAEQVAELVLEMVEKN